VINKLRRKPRAAKEKTNWCVHEKERRGGCYKTECNQRGNEAMDEGRKLLQKIGERSEQGEKKLEVAHESKAPSRKKMAQVEKGQGGG